MMDKEQVSYYHKMNLANRLLPLKINGELKGFITFFIDNEIGKYINRYPWDFVNDNPEGNTLYIDQFLSNKEDDNPKLSLGVWFNIKQYFKQNYPHVERIIWVRYKNGKTIRRECYVHS